MLRPLRAQNDVRRVKKILDRATLAHEFWVVTDRKIRAISAPTRTLKHRNNQRFGSTGKQSAAHNNRMMGFFLLESRANFASDALSMAQVEFAVAQAGSANAHKRDVRILDCGNSFGRSR